jgi:hypothetical protein
MSWIGAARQIDFRFWAKADLARFESAAMGPQLDLSNRGKMVYSITSSASARTFGGMSMPTNFAVLRLIMNL